MIDKFQLQEKLKAAIGDYLKRENVILIDSNLTLRRKKNILRILIDVPGGGITLDECAHINNELGRLLDAENLIQDSYILEVSSPGLDRPLVTKDDFSRCLNRKVRMFFNQGLEAKTEITGVIVSVNDTYVNINSEGQIQQIPFDRIRKAKQII